MALPLALTLCAAVSPVSAHDSSTAFEADRVYVGDPLFPMGSGSGVVSRNPDGITPMASTTKVMSLQVTLAAIASGVVDLDDEVTVSFAAASRPGSSMTDDADQPLATGEVMTLEDLMFGMVIPSGNNATWAIAEHVADAYLPGFGTVDSFVALMNARAADLGLTSSHYENPSGADGALQFTTARDLARLWTAGMANAEFRRFVAPVPHTSTGDFFGVEKIYTLKRSQIYPGSEGHKNGLSVGCNGGIDPPDDANGDPIWATECMVLSSRRIGRRLVAAMMQAVPGGDVSDDRALVLDLAFRRLFHPNYRGSGPGDAASRYSLVCPSTNRALTASIGTTGRTLVTLWATSVANQSYAISGKRLAPVGSLTATSSSQSRDVDAVALTSTRLVTATRVGTAVELRLWSVPSTGAPATLGAAVSQKTAGAAQSFKLVRLSSTLFASVARTTTNRLVIKVWRRTSTGLELVRSTAIGSLIVDGVLEIDAASAPGQQALRLVTVVRRTTGNPVVLPFNVDATTGQLTGGPTATLTEAGSLVSIVPAPVEALPSEFIVDRFYAVGYRRANGGLGLVYARVGFNGLLGALSPASTAGPISAFEMAPFGTSGLVTLARLSNGTLKPIVWETRRKADGTVTALRISDHQTTVSGSEPEICATPTPKAEGDFITGLREGTTPAMRLRGVRIGGRP